MKRVFGRNAGCFLCRSKAALVIAALAAFVRLSRVKFLAGGLAGGGLGTAIAAYEHGGHVAWGAYALAQSTITAFHLGTHYGNDYFDRYADRLTRPTPYSGGSGALVDGSLPAGVALVAALVCLGAGLAGTLALALSGAFAAAATGAAIAVLAWAYSAPPMRLLARGLGEVDTALVVAVLVPLCAYAAQSGMPDRLAIASTLPGAFAMFAMMLAVEYPDLAADAAAGKRNLVVRFGAQGAKPIAFVCLGGVYALGGTVLAAGGPPGYAIALAGTLPLATGLAAHLRARAAAADPACDEDLAARGVALFFVVTFYGLLAYGAGASVVGVVRRG